MSWVAAPNRQQHQIWCPRMWIFRSRIRFHTGRSVHSQILDTTKVYYVGFIVVFITTFGFWIGPQIRE